LKHIKEEPFLKLLKEGEWKICDGLDEVVYIDIHGNLQPVQIPFGKRYDCSLSTLNF
jgi:hypothetical protein